MICALVYLFFALMFFGIFARHAEFREKLLGPSDPILLVLYSLTWPFMLLCVCSALLYKNIDCDS